jgi:hypothetical protein
VRLKSVDWLRLLLPEPLVEVVPVVVVEPDPELELELEPPEAIAGLLPLVGNSGASTIGMGLWAVDERDAKY